MCVCLCAYSDVYYSAEEWSRVAHGELVLLGQFDGRIENSAMGKQEHVLYRDSLRSRDMISCPCFFFCVCVCVCVKPVRIECCCYMLNEGIFTRPVVVVDDEMGARILIPPSLCEHL